MKADSYITQKHTKKLCTYIKSLNVRYMTITPLEENIKKKALWHDFFGNHTQSIAIK